MTTEGEMKKRKSYDGVPETERHRMKDFEVIDKNDKFYICVRKDKHGNVLYKECFSRFDIDGVKNQRKISKIYEKRY